ncbi:hypothetical protein PJI17_32720, partial [Mycobacterium kansasii]
DLNHQCKVELETAIPNSHLFLTWRGVISDDWDALCILSIVETFIIAWWGKRDKLSIYPV